ncbi:MAG: DUF4340 domain-containing protein, partial [Acetobacteraceae bacterium]|nr:DUF4340 domain-containing protein [Acetobacteraceae bacterium]
MRRIAANFAVASVAAGMVAIIAGLSMTGRWPGHAGLEHFAPNGIIATPSEAVDTVEVTTRSGEITFHRGPDGWLSGGRDNAGGGEISKQIETGLRFLNVSAPLRILAPDQYRPGDLAAFGLDPPELTVALAKQGRELARVSFGATNPADITQYVEAAGRPGIYLLPRHVGGEWRLAAARAERLAQGSFLLSAPIAQIWAVEIVAEGQLARFERDNAGLWFHHFGQHTHVSPADAHVADPVRAPLIAAELAALDRAEARKIGRDFASDASDEE